MCPPASIPASVCALCLQPGTSLITWANSTYLAPHSPHQSPQTEDSPTHDSSEPLAVIKFHFPISVRVSSTVPPQQHHTARPLLVTGPSKVCSGVSRRVGDCAVHCLLQVLDPHTPTTTLSRAQREALAQAWGLASPLPRSDSRPPVIAAQHGVLSDSEALSLLQATGARTQSALLHEGQLSPMMLLTDWHNNQASASTTHHIQLPTSFAQQHTVQPAASQHSQSQPRSSSNGHHQRRTLLQRIHMRKQSQMASHITSAIASPFRALSAAVGLLAAGVSALWQESERAFAALHALVATPLVAAWTHLAADATARGARDLAAAQLARPLLALLPVSTGGQTAAAAAAAHMSTASSALGEAPLRADGAMRRSASPAPTISVPRTLSDLFQAQLPHSQCVLMARTLEHFKAFRFPKQTNQLAFVFDPLELGLSLSFGVEIFEPGHHTPLHVHRTGHELFFVLSGRCFGHMQSAHLHCMLT